MTDVRPNIWRLQAQFDTKGLIQALKDEDPNIRKRATAALYALGAVEAVSALREALDRETHPDVRASLVTALAHLSAEDTAAPAAPPEEETNAVERLLQQLQSDHPERIIQAARALGELKDKTAVEPLVLVFRSATLDGHVRLAAAEALLMLESAPAEVTLLGALRSRKWQLRRNAAAILGQLRADWAVVPLGHVLHDEHDVVARTARAALKRIATPEARRILDASPAESGADQRSTSETLSVVDVPDHMKPSEAQASPEVREKTKPSRPTKMNNLALLKPSAESQPQGDEENTADAEKGSEST
ncbi:MAG: HEAT repeat domain-containing protein [Chloroflexi bacterium]|nr:HEAT repeat domain-containing protein [Chloroflexota bacterium]